MMRKGENACYHFFPFPTMFSKAFTLWVVSSLPNNKILEWSKFKVFADDKITQSLNLV